MLTLKTLGELSFAVDGDLIDPLRSRTAAALLVYLACEQRPFTREHLAALFWPEHDASAASANLRTALKLLRKPFAAYLTISRQTVAFDAGSNHEIDAVVFARQIRPYLETEPPLTLETAAPLTRVLALYQGDFLQGFHLAQASDFEEWLHVQQNRYRRLAVRGLRRLVQVNLAYGRYQEGIDHAARLLALDPLDETAHRSMMALLWRSGRRSAALQQYATLRQTLADELHVLPGAETDALYERIRTAPTQPRHNLPAPATPFVGRTAELAALADNLAAPDCRLLTILGPGGIGKTRTLLELGRHAIGQAPGQFAHGVRLVQLAQLQDGRFLATAIAHAVGAPLASADTPEQALLDYLRKKEMLLLLDNFEHLLDEDDADASVAMLLQILEQAPWVKIVLTSRVRVQLHEEWVFDLHGLPTPPAAATDTAAITEFDAVRLFLQSARRIRRNFPATEENLRLIARVCRLLHGLPLAVEMAAAWVRQHSCAAILQQIEADLDFLSLPLRNIPPRHRTLRAVFDHSWQLLTDVETAVLRRLAVFRGPFSLAAAQAVSGCTPETLTALAHQSLLQASGDTYAMHELLRHDAARRLDAFPAEQQQAAAAHAAFYVDFVQQRTLPMREGRQTSADNEIAAVIDEIRAAWSWSLQQGRFDLIQNALEGVCIFFWLRGWLQEGLETAVHTAAAVAQVDPDETVLLAQIEGWQAEFLSWLGDYDAALALFERAVAVHRRGPVSVDLIFALHGIGRIHYWHGAYEDAAAMFSEGVAIAHHLEEGHWIALVLNNLASAIAAGERDYGRSKALYEESLEIARDSEDQLGCARALINMGAQEQEEGRLAEAEQLYAQSLAIYRALNYQYGIGAALNFLGQTAYYTGDFARAQALIEESYQLNWESGNRRATADSLKQLGNLAREMGDALEAQRRYTAALRLAQEIESEQLALGIMLETAVLHHRSGNVQHALTIALHLTEHAAAGPELVVAAQALIDEWLPQQPPEIQTHCRRQAQTVTVESVFSEPLSVIGEQ